MATVTILLFSILLLLCTNTLQTTPEDAYYTAAVVEYNSINDSELSALNNALNNAKRCAEIMKKAAEYKVDIIVFPELGILGVDKTTYIEIPDGSEKIIPANNKSISEILQVISKAAIDNHMYAVINIHELYKKGTKEYKYNTNVVFDREGAIIARYRKYNLFGEIYLDRPERPDYITFKTDFGVTFGTFICFDIIFEEPAIGLIRDYNITDIVYPTAWFSELPLLVAIQEQSSWAYGTNVNLLASGYNNIALGNSGSGIYAGRKGPVVYEESQIDGTRILIGKVPKMSEKGKLLPLEQGQILEYKPHDTNKSKNTLPILHQDLTKFKTQLIKPEILKPTKIEKFTIKQKNNENTNLELIGLQKEFEWKENLCNGTFCCQFNLKFNVKYYPKTYNLSNDLSMNKADAFYHFNFRLIAFDGIRDYIVGNTTGEQICAIMPCLNDKLDSCAIKNDETMNRQSVVINDKDLGEMFRYSTEFTNITIIGDFHNKRVLYLPSIITTSADNNTFGKLLQPNEFEFNIKNNTKSSHIELIINKPNKFASGGIYGRLFERDNLPKKSSADNLKISSLFYVSVIPIIICFILKKS